MPTVTFFAGFFLGAAIFIALAILVCKIVIDSERKICCSMFREFVDDLPKTDANREAVEQLFKRINGAA